MQQKKKITVLYGVVFAVLAYGMTAENKFRTD
jgi:hypothetical protein